MTKLTFYGGISTIGGNCVILEEDGHRIMLDNGMCFSLENDFYKDFLSARKNNDMRDYLRLGLVPHIDGIYGKEVLDDVCIDEIESEGCLLFESNLQSYEAYIQEHKAPFIEGVILSHAHLDHLRNILFMDPEIPVFCSQISYDLIKIISELSEDYLNYTHAEKDRLGNSSYFPGALKKKKVKIPRNFIILEPNKPHEISNFSITGFPTDHSLPGSMAVQIKTKWGKQIVYTGDIRFHGLPQDRNNSNHFVDTISFTSTDALITEGTRIDDEKLISEEDVYNLTLNRIKRDKAALKKLILVSFPWKNLSRFQTIYRIARTLKKTFVIQPKLAYILHNLGERTSLGIKDILYNDDIRVFLPRINSMTYSLGDYVNSKECLSYNINWNKETNENFLYTDMYGENKLIKSYEMHAHPENFMVHLEFYSINQLIDIIPPEQSLFFNMKTEPFDEEGILEQKVLENWIQRYKLNLIPIHASGHAPGSHILEMIEKINPRQVFPIHTEKPDLFTMKNALTKIEIGKTYEI